MTFDTIMILTPLMKSVMINNANWFNNFLKMCFLNKILWLKLDSGVYHDLWHEPFIEWEAQEEVLTSNNCHLEFVPLPAEQQET